MNLLVDGLSSQGKGTPAAQDWNSLIDLQEDQEILFFIVSFQCAGIKCLFPSTTPCIHHILTTFLRSSFLANKNLMFHGSLKTKGYRQHQAFSISTVQHHGRVDPQSQERHQVTWSKQNRRYLQENQKGS